jgi:hypothetical protein
MRLAVGGEEFALQFQPRNAAPSEERRSFFDRLLSASESLVAHAPEARFKLLFTSQGSYAKSNRVFGRDGAHSFT